MTIHFIISISQLESVSKNDDSFRRSRFDQNHFSSIIMKNENDSASHYEIKRLMNKRISRKKTQYLIKWLEYESADNWWYNKKNLINAQDLIDDYKAEIARCSNLANKAKKCAILSH